MLSQIWTSDKMNNGSKIFIGSSKESLISPFGISYYFREHKEYLEKIPEGKCIVSSYCLVKTPTQPSIYIHPWID